MVDERGTLIEALAQAFLGAERRIGQTINRRQLAQRIHLAPASLYAYLNGTTLPPVETLALLITALEIRGEEADRLLALRDEAALARSRRRSDGGVRRPPPRQLPDAPRRFVGRTDEIAELTRLCAAPAGLVVVDGTPGVGKTTLALQQAHRIAERFPDGQLYVDLRGFDERAPVDPGEALLAFIEAFGVLGRVVPQDTEARAGMYRSLLSERRVLVLLDNAGSEEQVRPLIAGGPGCVTMVTSRRQLDGLVARDGARRVGLELMTPAESRTLLDAYLAPERGLAEPAAVDDLIALCARLPLAISIAGAYADGRRSTPLREIVRDLRGADGQPGLLDVGPVFRRSYDVLPGPAQRLFRLLGVHPGPTIDGPAGAALLGVPAPPREALTALLAANLLDEEPPGRFRFHDLLRGYAGERATTETPDERGPALSRALELYLHTALRARHRIQPYDSDPPLPPGGPAGVAIDGYAAAMAWFAAELPTLRAMLSAALRYRLRQATWQLAWACTVFLRRTARHAVRVEMQHAALLAAERAHDAAAQATTQRLLADALHRIGHPDEALERLTRSVAACAEIGDADGVRQGRLSFVRVLESQGRSAEAFEHAEAALRLADPADDSAVADGYTAVAKQLCALGRFAEAVAGAKAAIPLYTSLANNEGLASALATIGHAEAGRGDYPAAIGRYSRAVELDLALGDHYWAARTLFRLAEAYEAAGDHGPASACRVHATELFGTTAVTS